jgi:hypothetical protein
VLVLQANEFRKGKYIAHSDNSRRLRMVFGGFWRSLKQRSSTPSYQARTSPEKNETHELIRSNVAHIAKMFASIVVGSVVFDSSLR